MGPIIAIFGFTLLITLLILDHKQRKRGGEKSFLDEIYDDLIR